DGENPIVAHGVILGSHQVLEKYYHWHPADVFNKIGDKAITAKTSVRSREADERAFE
ncbi:hypothetical protein E4U33_001427, partial [Claviceps sp. LM78 group G4]